MTRWWYRWAAVAIVLVFAGCGHQSNGVTESTQDNFGVQMAQQNLWREAMFRFKRAMQINPGDALAHNNLAVAYEANGDLESARKEYLEALKLDRGNSYIQKNYSRFVEFTSRNRKRSTTPKSATAPLTPTAPAGSITTDTGGALPPGRPVGTEPPVVPPQTPPPQPPAPQPPGGES